MLFPIYLNILKGYYSFNKKAFLEMQQTETQHNLLKQASIQSIELINQFEDEITPIQFKCLKCHTESEEYPDMLLSFYHWCPKCRENPEEILLSLLNQLSIKIVDKNIKKLIDYKIERDGKKAFIYIQKSDESTVQLCDMANKANIKLIIIPLNLLIKNTPELIIIYRERYEFCRKTNYLQRVFYSRIIFNYPCAKRAK